MPHSSDRSNTTIYTTSHPGSPSATTNSTPSFAILFVYINLQYIPLTQGQTSNRPLSHNTHIQHSSWKKLAPSIPSSTRPSYHTPLLISHPSTLPTIQPLFPIPPPVYNMHQRIKQYIMSLALSKTSKHHLHHNPTNPPNDVHSPHHYNTHSLSFPNRNLPLAQFYTTKSHIVHTTISLMLYTIILPTYLIILLHMTPIQQPHYLPSIYLFIIYHRPKIVIIQNMTQDAITKPHTPITNTNNTISMHTPTPPPISLPTPPTTPPTPPLTKIQQHAVESSPFSSPQHHPSSTTTHSTLPLYLLSLSSIFPTINAMHFNSIPNNNYKTDV